MKKLVSLVTILCVFALMFTFNVSAESIELVWSSIENNASGVAINADLELEFSADVDISKLSLKNVALNGSFDCVENASIADGTVDGFVWDETTYTLTIDFKNFGYGKRYIVDLIDVPFVGTEETYTGSIAFTTEMPSGVAESVTFLDASKEDKLTWYVWWADQSGSEYISDEQACEVTGGAYTRYNDPVTNWKEANAIVVEGKGAFNVHFSNAGDGTQVNDSSSYWHGVASLSNTEYTKVTIPFTYDSETAPDSTYVWVAPAGGSINPAYLRSIEFVNIPENVPFTNEKVVDVDCTQGLVFSSWNVWNGGVMSFDEAEGANLTNSSWACYNVPIGKFKSAEKLLIKIKGAAGKKQADIAFTSTDVQQCTSIGDATYARFKLDVSDTEYKTYECNIEHMSPATEPDTVRMWINEGYYVKGFEILPVGYTSDSCYLGDYKMIKNYGLADEEDMTKGGIEAGSYSAYLGGLYNLAQPKTISLINALYEGGKLVDVEVANSEVIPTGGSLAAPLVATIENVPDYTEGMEMKAFLFDENLTPLANAISVKDDKRVRVLIVGNSITRHQPAVLDGIVWEGNWGMAATEERYDYSHRLITTMENEGYNVECMIGNALGFEQLTVDSPVELPSYVEFNPDIVIATLGANCGNSTTFAEKYIEFVDAIGAEKNIIASTLWCGQEFWDRTVELATEKGWTTVHCNEDDPTGQDRFWGWSGMATFGQNGVGWHPGNSGMKEYSDEIWAGALEADLAEVAANK